MTQMTIPQLVKHLQLAPHPEGGWYREIHRSSTQISRADGEQRCGITTVLFLLAADQVAVIFPQWWSCRGLPMALIDADGSLLELVSKFNLFSHSYFSVDAPRMFSCFKN